MAITVLRLVRGKAGMGFNSEGSSVLVGFLCSRFMFVFVFVSFGGNIFEDLLCVWRVCNTLCHHLL